MATLPAALTDHLLEEFFLRLPPDDPASLITAALVCKRWRRILADRGFRRRFFKHHHRRSPLLGYFRQGYGPTAATTRLLFTPTSSFRPRNAGGLSFRYALDSRHGRVLVSHVSLEPDPSACRLAIWDPITDDLLSLPRLPQRKPSGYNFTRNAVLLCASSGLISTAAGCDDCDCHRGPFLVVFIGAWQQDVYAYVYSSQTGAWSHTTSAAWDTIGLLPCTVLYHNETRAKAVYGNAVYFKLVNHIRLLKYDLGAQEISSVDLPDRCGGPQILLLTASEYGGLLGVAAVGKLRIELWWSREAGTDRRFRWEPARVIELPKMPHSSMSPVYVLDIIHSLGAIIIRADNGVFSVDIESKRMTMLCDNNSTLCFVPYMSFCTPGASNCKNVRIRTQISSGRMIMCLVVIIGLWASYLVVHRFAAGISDGRHVP